MHGVPSLPIESRPQVSRVHEQLVSSPERPRSRDRRVPEALPSTSATLAATSAITALGARTVTEWRSLAPPCRFSGR